MKKNASFSNRTFKESAMINDATYFDYLERFEKIATSIFEWVNLPDTMNERFLERSLYFDGMAALFKDEDFGFINTRVAQSGNINIYGLPTDLNCYSYNYDKRKQLYTGIDSDNPNEAILVLNNWKKLPTASTLELFAYRLYEAERTCDVNIKAMKTPNLLVGTMQQKLMLQNLYNQYDGNQPVIFGDKDQLNTDSIKAISTQAPFVADKIMDYKKEIWNEALTFLGINNIMIDKKERLVSDEANSNNELINLNLQSYLIPRQKAAEQFNKKYNLTGDKAVYVRVRSDLHNIIKNNNSVIDDYNVEKDLEVENNG